MRKGLSKYKVYHITQWITRLTGILFLVLFVIFFAPRIPFSTFGFIEIGLSFIFLFIYLWAISAIIDNGLLNSTLIILSVLFFQALLYNAGVPERIINTHMLIIPGVVTLLMVLMTHRSYLRVDSELMQLDQKYKITLEMLQITPDILANNDLDTVLNRLLEAALKIMPRAQKGSILVRDGQVMKFHAAIGYDLKKLQTIEFEFEEMFQYRLDVLEAPAIIKDLQTFHESYVDRVKTKLLAVNQAMDVKSTLTCSLKLHDEIYGFINLDNIDRDDAFSEQDKIYVQHLANQIEVALNTHLLVKDIYRLSRYDELTGAVTRKYNQELMNKTLKQAQQNNHVFSVCVIDMNGLKNVNDQFGHDAGDQFLTHLCTTVKSSIQQGAIFARMGGDEFVLTLPMLNKDEALEIIKDVREKIIKSPFKYEKHEIPITFGCGITQYPNDSTHSNELIRLADQLMYVDKDKQKVSV